MEISRQSKQFCNDKSTDPNQALDGNLVGKMVPGVLLWTRIKQDVVQY